MKNLIAAWSIATGRKQYVPEHFQNSAGLSRGLTFADPALKPASDFPAVDALATENTDSPPDEPTTTITPQAGDIDNKE